jgi:protein subunit release factor A
MGNKKVEFKETDLIIDTFRNGLGIQRMRIIHRPTGYVEDSGEINTIGQIKLRRELMQKIRERVEQYEQSKNP